MKELFRGGKGAVFKKGLYVLLFVAALLAAYWPSFTHLPKRDQLYYHLEMSRTQGLGEIIAKSYSYNRTRTVMPGDNGLFRPGLFLLLAFQKYFFDYRTEYWRLVSLLIHAFCCLALLRLLQELSAASKIFSAGPLKRQAKILPVCFTLLFAFNLALADVVSWEHIQGYMVFTGLILAALIQSLKLEVHAAHSPPVPRAFLPLFSLLLAACFFHEAGVLFAPLFGLFHALRHQGHGWRAGKARLGVFTLLSSVSAIYLVVSCLDFLAHADHFIKEDFSKDLATGTGFLATLKNGWRFVVFCWVQPLFPFLLRSVSGPSGVLIWDAFLNEGSGGRYLRPVLVVLSVAVLGALAWVARMGVRRKFFFSFLVLAILFTYSLLYVALRMNVRAGVEFNFLGYNPQYIYFCLPLVICLIFQFVLLVLERYELNFAPPLGRFLKIYLIAILAASLLQTYCFNDLVAKNADIMVKIARPARIALDQLRKSGVSRVGFLFEDRPLVIATSKFGAPLSSILFGRFESYDDPEAVIFLPSGTVARRDDPLWNDLMGLFRRTPYYWATIPMDVVTRRKDGRFLEYHSSYNIMRDGTGYSGIPSAFPYFPVGAPSRWPFVLRDSDKEKLERATRREAAGLRAAFMNGELSVMGSFVCFREGTYKKFVLFSVNQEIFAVPGDVRVEQVKNLIRRKIKGLLAASEMDEMKKRIDEISASGDTAAK